MSAAHSLSAQCAKLEFVSTSLSLNLTKVPLKVSFHSAAILVSAVTLS